MIPEFPQFKNLELSDKEEVVNITSKYVPYSDFNFVSMWCWDIKGEMRLSMLNGNLVVRFTHYLTGEALYSFLGDNKVNETVEKILNVTIEEEVIPKLYLIPEGTAQKIALNKFKTEEDIDNFDYVFDLHQLSKYAGGQFMKKRNKVKQLLNLCPNITVETINLKDKKIKKQILELDEFWLQNKTQKDSNFKIKNEFLATNRFFQANLLHTIGIGIFIDKKLVGYSIISLLSHNFAISHFTKADTKYIGIYDLLMRESAKILLEKDCFFLNYEQDLGLPGLRESKKSFMLKYLKKFKVGFAD